MIWVDFFGVAYGNHRVLFKFSETAVQKHWLRIYQHFSCNFSTLYSSTPYSFWCRLLLGSVLPSIELGPTALLRVWSASVGDLGQAHRAVSSESQWAGMLLVWSRCELRVLWSSVWFWGTTQPLRSPAKVCGKMLCETGMWDLWILMDCSCVRTAGAWRKEGALV